MGMPRCSYVKITATKLRLARVLGHGAPASLCLKLAAESNARCVESSVDLLQTVVADLF